MKKPIMSKRRFEGGGEVEDKAAGLEASNKEAPMGFFERLRAGNIDDPESEAYKRLGAGRGRAERIPVEDKSFTDVPSKIVSRSEGMGAFKERLQASKDADTGITEGERIAQAMASQPSVASESAKPKPKPAAKDTSNFSNEGRYKSPVGTSTVKDTSNFSNEGRYKSPTGTSPSAKIETKSEPKNAPIDETKLSLSERIKLSREKSKSGSKTDSRSANERIRSAFGFKDGGSVSKASSRADGIAQRGKTRGVMR